MVILAEDGGRCQGTALALRPQLSAPIWPGSVTPVTGAPRSNPTAVPQYQVPKEFAGSDHCIEVVLAGGQAWGSRGTGLTQGRHTGRRCLDAAPRNHAHGGTQTLNQFSHMVSSCWLLILVSLFTP